MHTWRNFKGITETCGGGITPLMQVLKGQDTTTKWQLFSSGSLMARLSKLWWSRLFERLASGEQPSAGEPT